MAKKKTSVVLPGGIAGLVHQVQRGGGEEAHNENEGAQQQAGQEQNSVEEIEENPRQPEPSQEELNALKEETATKKELSPEPAPQPEKRRRGRPAAPKMDITPTEKAEKEYHIVKDSGADSWQLFLDLGKIYKTRDERLATIYIDPDLKRVLDRLKTASGVKLPTAAILSSIVARFIFDHEKKIKDVIFGERLI